MLELVPITLKEANAFVERYHRHHKPVVGHKFSIAASDGEKIVGVAIVGRPVSRYLDNGLTLEVNRLCTDGTRNACSFLYSAAWRAARNLGYKKLITYILVSETGSSLKAAGWKCVGGGAEADKKRHVICISDGCLEEIGEYATKERCLEVLDEIQKACVSYLFTVGGAAVIRGGMDVQPFAAVIPRLYEMPEK